MAVLVLTVAQDFGVPGNAAGVTLTATVTFIPGTASAATPAIDSLTDNFDSALDAGKWTPVTSSANSSVSTSGGKLVVNHYGNDGLSDPSGSQYPETGVKSAAAYPIEGSSAYVRMFPYASTASDWGMVLNLFALLNTGNHEGVGFQYAKPRLYFKIWNEYQTGWADADPAASIVYDATNHAWLRLREAGGTIYWDTAPDNAGVPGTWTNQASKAHSTFTNFSDRPAFLSGARAVLLAQGVSSDMLDSYITSDLAFDGFNTNADAPPVPGDAAGTTFSRTVSLLAGSATGAATKAGVTFTATASLIAGAASGGATGTAPGTTFARTLSLLAGGATGAATVAGVTLARAASLLAGAASGGAAAAGATFARNASLTAGPASGGASATGVTFTRAASLIAGPATGGAARPGVVLPASLALLPGSASGGASRVGVTFALSAAFAPASATGAASAIGFDVEASTGLFAGGATGGAFAPGTLFVVGVSFLPGMAVAGELPPVVVPPIFGGGVPRPVGELFRLPRKEGRARGVVFDVTLQLIAGEATGAAYAYGEDFDIPVRFIPGKASGKTNPRALREDEELVELLLSEVA